ncbi:DNA-3-methyladenine glycosylase I [Acetobacterium sp.]|uniref:DNA-3-methyladenine glycosylase I n=1 Tax=Acetobacterium sp. TaxID=1872094 RepID=UPI002F3E29A0
MTEILNAAVSHIKFGNGKITKLEKGFVTILFNDFEKKFAYPGSFKNFLSISAPDLSEKIRIVIEKIEFQEQELNRIEEEKRIEALRLKEIQDQIDRDEEIAKEKLKRQRPGKVMDGGVRKTCLLDNEQMAGIFQRVKETLFSNSNYTQTEFDERFDVYKNYENRLMSNNEYYQLIVNIIFYSGFKAATVEKHLDTIHAYFPDYKVVLDYNLEQIEHIKNDPKMIQNKRKIDACVKNAEKIDEIVKEYGSVKAYINSFEPNLNEDCLNKLKKSLEKNFSYLGGITSYHFMTDIGLNVLKPDRVIARIFYRLGLIADENELFEAVKIGRAFSIATKIPIRYIDVIFVMYGQLNQEKLECICSEKNPKCQKCGVKIDCQYAKENGMMQ